MNNNNKNNFVINKDLINDIECKEHIKKNGVYKILFNL